MYPGASPAQPAPRLAFTWEQKITTHMENLQELQAIDVIESSGLEPETVAMLKKNFLPFLEQAREWKSRAKGLVVTDAGQTREMKMAREARLALREIRVNADKARKALKADALAYGRAVQGVYNTIEAAIKPIEEYLMEQEQFIEIQAKKERERLDAERAAEIRPWVEFGGDLTFSDTPYGNMTPEAWAKYLQAAKDAKDAHEKAEAERIAKEKAEAEERERLRKENERLQAEARERERAAAEERRKMEEQARKEREEAARKLAAERAERERLEEEARKREEEESKAKAAEEEARRKAEAAPDRDKLLAYANELGTLPVPVSKMSTKAGKQAAEEIMHMVLDLSSAIEDIANRL